MTARRWNLVGRWTLIRRSHLDNLLVAARDLAEVEDLTMIVEWRHSENGRIETHILFRAGLVETAKMGRWAAGHKNSWRIFGAAEGRALAPPIPGDYYDIVFQKGRLR